MKSIALYGGSFNPPHVAHQLLALWVLETQPVDELWFVPTFQHAFDKPLAPFAHRLAMCELAAAPLGPRARVSDVERDLEGKSRTLLTVKRLEQLAPGARFSVVIGEDLVGEIDSWFGAEELRRLVSFIVVGRQGAARHEGGGQSGASAVAMPAISSTQIRAALAVGAPVEGLLPRSVLAYIHEHGLFEPQKG